jgi:prophage regulatory protein
MSDIVLEAECKELTHLHPSTRWRLEKQGQFPRRFKIGNPTFNGRVAWSRDELTAWLVARMAARNNKPTGI